jgi:Amt family ammonium transporter
VAIPEYVFVCFQMTFAAITVALVLGSVVERIKFSAVMAFAVIWLTIVYFPIAHMVWAANGLLFTWSPAALDFAGGTVVHINSGVSALVACLILGKRIGYPTEYMAPHSLTMTGIGTAIAIFIARALTGLRVSREVEREGLDLGEHGERAYNY